MKSTVKELAAPVLALGLVCLIVTSLLALTNYFTAPVIANAGGDKANASRLVVLPEGDRFVKTELEAEHIAEAYRAENGAGFAITARVTGYHGEITVMFGVNSAGEITGVAVLEQSETQGLGERITSDEYKSRYIGKSGTLVTVKGSAANENEIAALTGATASSSAMTTAANAVLAAYEQLKGAGG